MSAKQPTPKENKFPTGQATNHQLPTTNYAPRPPIVVVLGHVDHGKTTILDKIRQTKVAEKEAGGITQHIGAYQVVHTLYEPQKNADRTQTNADNFPRKSASSQRKSARKITFLDTPGHEAFSAIRSRGARVADIAVLVVAADEGVKPQTKEAIQIIKEAEIPFVVAINKTDKEGANTAKVRQELAESEVQVEDYGGTVPVVELSAQKGEGINELLEMILLVAEMEELSAPLEGPAKGVVIESHMDAKRGLVATLIVHEGELKTGNWVTAGSAYGRVKMLEDFLGGSIKIATASQPCLMLGWESAPGVGQEFQTTATRQEAEKIAVSKAELGPSTIFVKEVGTEEQKTNKRAVNLIIKADVQGSLEAIDQTLKTIRSEEVEYNVVNFGVGNIGDSDIKNARATGSAVLGFHVSIDGTARQMAERDNIRAQAFDVIYELVETVRSIMSDLLEPEIRRIPLGKLKILATFKSGAKSQIVGGKVTQGKITRGAIIDVIRNGVLLITGRLGQLQHNKADVAEVAEGLEAGIRFDSKTTESQKGQSRFSSNQDDLIENRGSSILQAKSGETRKEIGMPILIQEEDVLEVYEEEKIKRSI